MSVFFIFGCALSIGSSIGYLKRYKKYTTKIIYEEVVDKDIIIELQKIMKKMHWSIKKYKGDVFDKNINLSELKWEIKHFTTKQISNDCILATYKLIKHSELNEYMKYSLRSSTWKCLNGKWKMIFHQGTLIP
ncbi:MAG TPA: hypothetical protein VIM70_23305 [Clostridium sp.]